MRRTAFVDRSFRDAILPCIDGLADSALPLGADEWACWEEANTFPARRQLGKRCIPALSVTSFSRPMEGIQTPLRSSLMITDAPALWIPVQTSTASPASRWDLR